MLTASGSERPESVSSSRTLSKMPLSAWSRSMMGKHSASAGPKTSDCMTPSRESMAFTLPRIVLISPLWQRKRKGCARLQAGKVFVEKRLCTRATCDSKSSSSRSG